MNLYDNYCYPDIQSAAQAEISSPALVTSSGLLTGQSVTLLTDTTATMVYRFTSDDGLTTYDISHFRTFPSCAQVGYLTNHTGLSLQDVTEISFGVILVWVTAFAFRAMMRPTGVR